MSDPNRKEYSYSEKPNSSDLIYRQAAIDAVEKESQVDGAYGYMDTKSIVDLLNNLPAAQQNMKNSHQKKQRRRSQAGVQCLPGIASMP